MKLIVWYFSRLNTGLSQFDEITKMTQTLSEFTNSALVTGATGFVGGNLASRLVAEGWRVKVLVRDASRLSPTLQSGTEIIRGGLVDINEVRRAARDVNIIFHCAANVSTWDAWDAYYAANVQGVKNLLQAIVSDNPGLSRLVHVSTVDVYGFPITPCNEQCQTSGGGFGYGETKRLGEEQVRTIAGTHGIPYTIIRPCNVIGPGSQFISRIGRELQSGLMLTVDGGSANAGLLYIENLVDDLIWASGSEKARGECYNVRDEYDVNWKTFLGVLRQGISGKGLTLDLPFIIADLLATSLETLYKVSRVAREPVLHRLLVRIFGRTCGHSSLKIRNDRGNAHQTGFDEAMNRCCQWYMDTKTHLDR